MTFQYDNRDRLIHETRVVNRSTTAYDIGYTYDGLGNRGEYRLRRRPAKRRPRNPGPR